jgi:hypothetical protein
MGCTTSKAVPVGEDTSYGEHTKKVGNGKHQASQPADGANTSTAGKDGETPDIVPLEQHNGDAEPTESENKGIQEEVIQAAASADVQSSPVPSASADGEAANSSIQVAEDNWVMVNKTEETSAVETAAAADGDASTSGPIADAQDTSAVLHISEEQDDQLSHATPEVQIKDASVVSHDAAEVSTSAQKEDVEDKPLPTNATPVPSVPTEATTAPSVPSEVTTVPAMPTEATTISSFSNEVAATESATSIEAAEASATEVTSAEPASVPVDEAATTVEVQETVCAEPTSCDVDPQQSELASKSNEALPAEESQPTTDKQDQEASASNTEVVAETASGSEQKGDVETVGEKIVQEVIAEAVRQVETSVQSKCLLLGFKLVDSIGPIRIYF